MTGLTPRRLPGRPANPKARAARRAQLLAAARTCFARDGFAAASVAEVAKEAGISVAGLYQTFPSKADLVAAIIEEDLAADLASVARIAAAPSPVEAMVASVRMAEGEPEVTRLRAEIFAQAGRDEALAARVRAAEAELVAAVAGLLRGAAARGQVAPEAASPETALLLIALVEGVFSCRATGLVTDDAAFEPAFRAFLARALGVPRDAPSGTDPGGRS